MNIKYNIGKLTTFKVDSYTNNFFDIKTEYDFNEFLDKSIKFNNFFIFAWWSNILLKKFFYENYAFIRYFKRWIKRLDNLVFEVDAWENINFFINYLDNLNIKSLNPLFWLPWTVGWAVVGNAWSFWCEIWNFVEEVEVLDLRSKKFIKLKNKELNFSYRYSILKNKSEILLVKILFDFKKDNLNYDIKDKLWYARRRKENQPHWNTCWSYFKNIYLDDILEDNLEKIKSTLNYKDLKLFDNFVQKKILPAWWIIEKAWLKWVDFWWVKVSEKHANFIINYANKYGEKIYKLWNFIKEKVFEKFWIYLKEEVVIL